ncbi:MAG: arylamine N-acetyltransferase, partial [Lachnospiraceae bacterium]|nr:arylamine N-acetyltransferase [Lachnospiraceae bacterium]
KWCEDGKWPAPTLEFLNQLVEAHQKHIVFENLDAYYQKGPFTLSNSELYEKIIVKKRGGFCFELNGLFINLLRTLGYRAWSCLCRVVRGGDVFRPVSHRGNLVMIEDKLYFCDVGFGGPMPCAAVLVESGLHQKIGGEEFWPVEEEYGWWSLWRIKKGNKDDFDEQQPAGEQMELLFQNSMADPKDFVILSAYQTESPDAVFRKTLRANIRTDHGYKSVFDMTFTEKKDGETVRRELKDEAERDLILKDVFGLCL